ncbi:MAG: extracellular solute-binding protein [Clostridia bacterium]|nr:extracellular solute-binding protein [Clostridia bacterium]
MYRKINSGVAVMLLAILAVTGCASQDGSSTPKETQPIETLTTEAVTETTEIPRIEPKVPADLDFEGHTFTILNNIHSVPLWTQTDIAVEEQTGESLNDAIYNRNKIIEEKYNCSIASLQSDNVSQTVTTLVRAGDSSVDVVTHYLRNFAAQARQGLLIDLFTVDTMDLSAPWYDTNCVTEVSILNRLYGIASDITLMDEQATGAIVFNKSVYNNYDIDDTFGNIYEIVKDGKWTFEVLKKMVTSVSSDLDGDSARTENDLYGMLYQRDTLTSFFTGFGINIATKNANDIPEMTLMTDRNITIIDEIFDLLYQEDYCMNVMAYFGESFWSDEMVKIFQADRTLMMWIRLRDVENLRSMDTDFGILPVPKYSESDANYSSAVNSYVGTMTCIPQTNYNPAMTGYFIEALASESHYSVVPAYYDLNLQGKVSRDEESREMLDIIFANRHYDLGEIYDPANIANQLIAMTMTNDRDIASKWAKNEKNINKQLEKMIQSFEEQ